MDIAIKISLATSLFVNLLIFALSSIWVYKKGGIPYLMKKLSFFQVASLRTYSVYDNPFYWDKKSHFDTLPKSEADIVFLGDSITDHCEWQEAFRNARIKNRGIAGDTTEGVLNRLDEIVESKPKKLFIMIGINDINQGRNVEDIFNNHKRILEKIKDKIPDTKVFIQSILPVNNQKIPNHAVNDKVIFLNAKLKKLANELAFHYRDLFSFFLDDNQQLDAQYTTDGVHLNGQGYLLWQKIIEKDVLD